MKTKAGIGLATMVIAGILVWASYYKNRVYPGVSVANVELGGMRRERARESLTEILGQSSSMILRWGNREWTIEPLTIDLKYDIDKTLLAAMEAERKKIIMWKPKEIILDPVFAIDEEKLGFAIASISAELNIPAKEPEINYDKTNGVINITPGENGQALDTRLLLQRILLAIKTLDKAPIEIPVVQLTPKLDEAQIQTTKSRAMQFIGKTLEVKGIDPNQSWILDDSQILAWIDPQNQGWKDQAIDNWVAELAKTVNRPAENASFRVVGEGRVEEFKPGKSGLRIKQAETKSEITGALRGIEAGSYKPQVLLVIETTEAEIKTGDANNLGIKELVGRGESWFSGSIDNRIFNIKKATEAINGILIAPGETFSFNEKIGEVSQATGYKPAYIIKDGKTVLGDGGGVCQVSSTLFRAVLRAGLPIKERFAHAYRVHYYEEKSEPGFDATIFQPSPDFKFVNDTPAYLLLQTTFDPVNKHVVFDFYGTSDGREVTLSKARIWEVIPPPPALYQDDPTKPVGYQVQIEHPAWGAKVAFDWKVVRGNEVLQERTFYSNYAAWRAVYLRGTKQ